MTLLRTILSLAAILAVFGVGDFASRVKAAESWTKGAKTLLYMRVAFEDDLTEPVSEQAAASAVAAASAFFVEQSYGLFSLTGTITPLLQLPETKAYYGASPPIELMLDAREAARSAGFEPDDYDLDLVRNHPIPGFDFSGTSSVGEKNLWLQHPSLGVLVHELGHNLGLHHSSLWRTIDGSAAGPGQNVPYGDTFDTMGQPQSTPGPYDFNAFWKHQLDWLPGEKVSGVAETGTYRLYAYDGASLTDGQIYALRVRKDAARDYWLSYRGAVSGNAWARNGVVINWNPWAGSTEDTQLLDTTPGSPAGASDAPLLIGRTFSDPEAKVHITPLAWGMEGDQPWIDVHVHLGNSAGNTSPAVELETAGFTGSVNQVFEFLVTAFDADGDDLVYDWDFGDGTVASSTPMHSHSWSQPGRYFVSCRVSDRRGGATSSAVLITIDNPSTYLISGTISAEGAPLAGVLVKSSSGQSAKTDSTGHFVLTNLETGEQNITAQRPGYLFESVQDETLLLDSDREGFDFTGSPQAPDIVLQPQGATLAQAASWALTVTATGLAPLSYQWRHNGVDIPGATASSLGFTAIDSGDVGEYRVAVWNEYGTNLSDVAALSVVTPLNILAQPQDVVANVGDTAVFSIMVEGTEPILIQWLVPIEDPPYVTTGSTLAIQNVRVEDAGSYAALVFNQDGFLMSSNAVLSINRPPVPAQTTWERLPGTATSIPVSALLGTDPDGDSLSLAGFEETTTQGGTITLAENFLHYSSSTGLEADDQFSYTVSDGRGGEAVGVVTVTVFPETARPREVTIEQPTPDELIITFLGAGDRNYSVVFADHPNATEWQLLGLAQHLGEGTFSFVDWPPTGTTTRYYRLRFP